MKKPRTYVDTSVFGGVFDDEFKRASETFFAQTSAGLFFLLTSSLVQDEIALAPNRVRTLFSDLLAVTEMLPITQEALSLRQAYLDAKIVSNKSRNDALHVALATVNNCQIIVSWNFKHIVHYDKIDSYNAINVLNGHSRISICTLAEVIRYEKEKI